MPARRRDRAVDRGAKRAAGRERADVKLENTASCHGRPRHSLVPPFEAVVIDHLARPVHVLRLKMRGRIRNLDLAVDAVLVERAGAHARDRRLEPALRQRLHRMRAIEHESTRLAAGAHRRKVTPSLMQLGAKAHAGRHAAPRKRPAPSAAAPCSFAAGPKLAARALARGLVFSTVQRSVFGQGWAA